MNKKIKIQVFGKEMQKLPSLCGCGNKTNNGCGGCKKGNGGNCGGCNTNILKNDMKLSLLSNAIINLKNFFLNSDVKDKVVIEFIDLDKNSLDEYSKVKNIIENGFETPIVVIDDIIRYYGGISNFLVYKDVKELLE